MNNIDKLVGNQRTAAVTDNKNLLVSAAAGSGKTFTLTCRVVRKLTDKEHPISPENLLIATFTVSAATQMRNEISSALAQENSASAARARRLLATADIGTIDSFLLKLVSRYGGRLGLPVTVNVDDGRCSALERRLLSTLLEEKYRRREEGFMTLAELFAKKSGDGALFDAVTSLHRYRCKLPDPERQLKTAARHLSAEGVGYWKKNLAAQAARPLANLLSDAKKLKKEKIRSNNLRGWLDLFIANVSACYEAAARLDYDALFAAADFGLRRSAPDFEQDNDIYAQTEGLLKRRTECMKAIKSLPPQAIEESVLLTGKYASLLISLSDEYEKLLRERKLELGVFGFSDITRYALELLTVTDEAGGLKRSPLALELAADYDEILLDEFQDTNPLQAAIFSVLSNGHNLYCVGDVKQSIYRFRDADPGIFTDTAADYADGELGRVIPITSNFRTDPRILDAVNFIFERIMQGECAEINYDENHRLNPFDPEKFDPAGGFEVCLYGGKANIHTEAKIAAEKIKSLLCSEIYAKNKTGPHPAQPRDFCVMTLTNAQAQTVASVLADYGIPVSLTESGGFFDTYEISALLAALHAVDNPQNDLYLLSALMSPVWAFSPDEVAALRGSTKDSLFSGLTARSKQDDELGLRCRDMLHKTELLRRYGALLPPSELIGCLTDMTGFSAALAAGGDGSRRLDNISRFIRFAAERCSDGDTLSEFLSLVERLAECGATPKFGSSAQNCVTVCTVHKAKGLEYPVCLLLCSGARPNTSSSEAICINKRGLGLRIPNLDTQLNVPLAVTSYEEQRQENAERMRVLYVALTRAQHRMYMLLPDELMRSALPYAQELQRRGSISVIKPPSGLWPAAALMLHPDGGPLRQAAGAGELEIAETESRISVVRCEPGEISAADSETAAADEELTQTLLTRFAYTYPEAALTSAKKKYTVTELVHDSEEKKPAKPIFIYGKGGTGYGTELHAYLQLCDFTAAKRDSRAEAVRLVRIGKLNDGAQRQLDFSTVDKFFASPLFGELSSCGDILREFDFICSLPLGRLVPDTPAQFAAEPALLQGCADCIGVKSDGLLLIDYKSDNLTDPEQFKSRYADQLRLYAECLEKVFGIPVYKKSIFSFRLGAEIII